MCIDCKQNSVNKKIKDVSKLNEKFDQAFGSNSNLGSELDSTSDNDELSHSNSEAALIHENQQHKQSKLSQVSRCQSAKAQKCSYICGSNTVVSKWQMYIWSSSGTFNQIIADLCKSLSTFCMISLKEKHPQWTGKCIYKIIATVTFDDKKFYAKENHQTWFQVIKIDH